MTEKQDTDSTEPEGTCTKMSPDAGSKVAKGSAVKVWFSAGPQSTQVPDVKERSQEEARSILESAGFKVNAAVKTEDSADIAKDMVTKTDPAAGQSVPKGTTITIYVSSGMTTVPSNLVGQSKDSVLQQYEGKFSFTVEQESSDTVEAGLITRVSLIRALPSHRAGSSPFGCPRARRRSLCRISPLALTTSPPNSCSRPWASRLRPMVQPAAPLW